MKIKYKNDIYQVNIQDYFLIKKEQVILKIKRLWRYFKRVYSSIQSLFIIFVFTLIYLIIIYLIGKTNHKYNTFLDAIWEFKEYFLSTFIITFAIDFSSKEQQRHKNLISQQYIAEDVIAMSDEIIRTLLNFIGYEYQEDIFLTENHIKKLEDSLTTFKCNPTIKVQEVEFEELKITINEMTNLLQLVCQGIKQNQYIISDNDKITGINLCTNIIKSLNIIINEITPKNKVEQLKKEIMELSENLLFVCALLRRPWRWDYNRDQKIRNMLLKYANQNDFNDIKQWF